jgi:superfamily II DNA or RNA helicase
MRDINKETLNSTINLSRSSFFMKWYLDRGLRLVDYQQDILSNKIEFKGEPIVLAVSPGGGKTLMSIAAIEKYCADNPTHRVLVLTHGQTVLRSQYANNIFKHRPNFSWSVVVKDLNSNLNFPQMKSKDLKTINKQVIISLPQSLNRKDLPLFDLVVVDEAHQFYFAKMVQILLKRICPRNELLLTGTPSPFVARKYKNIIAVSLEILFKEGMVSDPIIEIAGSTYNFKMNDYNSFYELKDKVEITQEDTNSTLNMVLTEICRRLRNCFDLLKRNSIVSKDVYNYMTIS